MRVFDCHSDTFIDVTDKRTNGMKHVIEKCHKNKLQAGDVQAMICGVWIDPPRTANPMPRMLEILGSVSEEIAEMGEYARLAYNAADIRTIWQEDKLAIVWGMEGLSGLQGDVNFIDALYRLGVRHAMLTWNEENEFATGVGSANTDRGLTANGREVLRRMEHLGMLVDVSHANEKTFWDIYDNTEKPFIASHSNAYKLCKAARNLKDEQIKALAVRGGVMGINAWSEFIDREHPDVEALANHVDYIADIVGIDHIACGFDFCDYLGDDAMSFADDSVKPTAGIESAAEVQDFIAVLSRRGYRTDDLEKIAYRNIMRVLEEVLK